MDDYLNVLLKNVSRAVLNLDFVKLLSCLIEEGKRFLAEYTCTYEGLVRRDRRLGEFYSNVRCELTATLSKAEIMLSALKDLASIYNDPESVGVLRRAIRDGNEQIFKNYQDQFNVHLKIVKRRSEEFTGQCERARLACSDAAGECEAAASDAKRLRTVVTLLGRGAQVTVGVGSPLAVATMGSAAGPLGTASGFMVGLAVGLSGGAAIEEKIRDVKAKYKKLRTSFARSESAFAMFARVTARLKENMDEAQTFLEKANDKAEPLFGAGHGQWDQHQLNKELRTLQKHFATYKRTVGEVEEEVRKAKAELRRFRR